ncbi:TPA: hypothetical protein ACX6PR_002593 [Photobacterium damselae]
MMSKALIGVAGISTILISCVSCTSIPETLYYKAMTEKYNPINYADTLVITGTKPKELKLEAFVFLKGCESYNYKREYIFEAEDLGDKYKFDLPVRVKNGDQCRKISSFGIDAYWVNGQHASIVYPIRIKYIESEKTIKYENEKIDVTCFDTKTNGFYNVDCNSYNKDKFNIKNIDYNELKKTKRIEINVLKGMYWDRIIPDVI